MSLVAAAEADRQAQALLDVRSDEPVIDLRDRPLAGLPPPPPKEPDRTLTVVLNRRRYLLFGVGAVRCVSPHDRALTELAALASRATPPDIDDLIRQRAARRSIRRQGRRQRGARVPG
ncbi:MAG: hypothetical protein ACXWA3_07280 [Acidimicrobiales bacterium]